MDITELEYLQYIDAQLGDITTLLFCNDSSNNPKYKAAYLLGCLHQSVHLRLENISDDEDQDVDQ